MTNIERKGGEEFKIEKREPRNEKEFIDLTMEVGRQIENEKKKGFGKLKNINKIPEIKEKETFTDQNIVYLPNHGEAIFVGDTHGEVQTTERIIKGSRFAERAAKGEDVYMVFLGDYVDRGNNPLENLETLLNLKKAFGERVILLRGNHDFAHKVNPHEFPHQVTSKFSSLNAYNKTQEFFDKLPNTLVSANGVVAMHAGCPSDVASIKDINKGETPFDNEIFWNDPEPAFQGDYLPNPRGAGKMFGQKALDRFLDQIGARVLVRSHQYDYGGFASHLNNKVITIFSSSLHRVAKPVFYSLNLGAINFEGAKINVMKMEDEKGFFRIPPYDEKVMHFEKERVSAPEPEVTDRKKIEKSIAENRKWVADKTRILTSTQKLLDTARIMRKNPAQKLNSQLVEKVNNIRGKGPIIEAIFILRENAFNLEYLIAGKKIEILKARDYISKNTEDKNSIRKSIVELRDKRIKIQKILETYMNEKTKYYQNKIKKR